MTHSSTSIFAPPMSEETVEKTSQRVQSSLRDLGIIARELLKGSRSEEALMSSAKQFAQHEGLIESCTLNVSKLEVISQQLALHEECMEQALSNVEDLEWKLNRIINRTAGAPASHPGQVTDTPKAHPIPRDTPLEHAASEEAN
ncbi:hypothetical protein BV898_00210 [Hypsibius exemplaris]|uniref:BLOC-1-related complex subunit 7 n=1 Tax=Hypsibius exemplaris TaxID=2072580 RepID=A0A1W0XF30_HYPEX|nr:hypothetical protein BV898_00210 [Hypsibius exemplaris]